MEIEQAAVSEIEGALRLPRARVPLAVSASVRSRERYARTGADSVALHAAARALAARRRS